MVTFTYSPFTFIQCTFSQYFILQLIIELHSSTSYNVIHNEHLSTWMCLLPSYYNIFQYPMTEFVADTDHILHLISSDPKFDDLLQTLTHDDVMYAVTDTFNLIYSASTPEKNIKTLDLTPAGCLAVSVIVQLLVCQMTKRVMQLMTPEGLILKRNKIPLFYINHYLNCQTHFCLKNVIKNYYSAFKATRM